MNYRQIIYYLLLIAIVFFSFFLYSSRFYPLLSSDDALNILMAHYYKLPNDFYCWGQNRGGTLIPLISQIFIKLFNCSAVISVSFANYFVLILGFLGFSSLMKSNYYKIILAIIWFLPFQRFIDIVRFPIGVEYSLIGIAIFLISRLENGNLKWYMRHILLVLIVLVFLTSIWVSDLAIVSIAVLLFVLFLFDLFKNKKININKTVLSYFFVGISLCYIFINYAKSFAIVKTETYLSLNGITEITHALRLVKEALWKIFIFNTNEPLVSIYTYLALIFIAVFVFIIVKKKMFQSLFKNKWIVFFLMDFAVILAVLLSSSWVLSNGMGRWYFVGTYISLSMAIIIALDNLDKSKSTTFLKYSILLVVLVGAISPVYTMQFNRPKSLKPMIEVVGEFKQLGEIGVISEFWNSYITSCPDPELIKATPHDLSNVRNQEIVDMVFERENIYLIKDRWLETFPDTVEQFGYTLLKENNQFSIGRCEVCKYRKIKLYKVLALQNLKYAEGIVEVDNLNDNNTLFVSKECDSCKGKFIVSGAYIPIGIGEFTVSFKLKANDFTNDEPLGFIDVVADWGNTKLTEKIINKNDFVVDDYIYIDLDFTTLQRYSNLEFRIYYAGGANLYFEKIVLKEN